MKDQQPMSDMTIQDFQTFKDVMKTYGHEAIILTNDCKIRIGSWSKIPPKALNELSVDHIVEEGVETEVSGFTAYHYTIYKK